MAFRAERESDGSHLPPWTLRPGGVERQTDPLPTAGTFQPTIARRQTGRRLPVTTAAMIPALVISWPLCPLPSRRGSWASMSAETAGRLKADPVAARGAVSARPGSGRSQPRRPGRRTGQPTSGQSFRAGRQPIPDLPDHPSLSPPHCGTCGNRPFPLRHSHTTAGPRAPHATARTRCVPARFPQIPQKLFSMSPALTTANSVTRH